VFLKPGRDKPKAFVTAAKRNAHVYLFFTFKPSRDSGIDHVDPRPIPF
jgi:hypothetical protein